MYQIMLVEDEALVRESMAQNTNWEKFGFAPPHVFENGRQAADYLETVLPDVVITDICMPFLDGLELAKLVYERFPETIVVVLTGFSEFSYAQKAIRYHVHDYLLKPVDPDELEASIRRAMRQIEAERKLEELARTTELSPEPETPEVPENPEEGAPEAESPEGENSQTAMVMTQVRRYLEDNYMFDLSLDSVGEILHISPAYLSAQFKKYQKMNFLDCLTELRINAAKELLADPFRSSAEVASMVGYEDASYFARAFKKRTGMTPTQYRRQAGKKSAEAHL